MYRDIVEPFQKSIFSDCVDISKDFFEIAIDQIIEDDFVKTIPIVSTLTGMGKFVCSIRDLLFVKKTLIFIQNINSGKICKEDLEKHKRELDTNIKRKNEELEFLIAVIDKETEYKKIELLASLYISYLSEEIICDWYDFKFCYDILGRVSLYDMNSFKDIYQRGGYRKDENYDIIAMSRLAGCGLVDLIQSNIENVEYCIRISELGKVFYRLCLEHKDD